MTAFVLACAVTLALVLAWLTLPLWRPKKTDVEGAVPAAPAQRRWATVAVALLVPAVAVGMYAKLSNWDWDAANQQAASQATQDHFLQQLERKLESDPNDVEGWLMLGRSYTQLGRFGRAADAYQQAYDLTKGQNVQALTGLGEALALTDEASLSGRAGQLFDAALVKEPNDPKALWYGGMAALQTGNLRVGRDRLQLLLQAENIPEQMRTILQGKVDEINGELGDSGSAAASVAASTAPAGTPSAAPGASATAQAEPAKADQQRSIKVAIKVAPNIQQQLTGPIPLFVLARDPSGGGPPLAVQRHSSTQLPLTVTLTEADAMLPARTIASVPRVQIVARLSRSGAPQASSGDFFGQADYEFGKSSGPVQITIDQSVPSATTQAEPASAAGQQRVIKVMVKVTPEIQQQLTGGALPLFVLARDPSGGGPPLAVQRHSSTELPFTATLTEGDAMIPARTIAGVPRVQVVARISRSGAPQASSGDFFGEASYEFGKNSGTVQITINQRVP